jgi:cytochrome b involved in lipid metabolism
MELADVLAHNTTDDCWIIVNAKVYDVTNYLNLHPGGSSILFGYAGKDATEAFRMVRHSRNATRMLDKYEVGQMRVTEQPTWIQFIYSWLSQGKP